MVRGCLALAGLLAAAGCGGSPDAPDERRPAPERRILFDLRSADARSPLVVARGGVWRCETAGRIRLAISAEGEATLTIDGRLVASVAPTRAVVNRACDRDARAGVRGAPRHGRPGGVLVRCAAPASVLVDFGGGDLTVRAPGGRFLAGAAVRPDRAGVAGYWGAGCAPT